MGLKYYAVVSGKTPGIYNDWASAEKMVKGFPGAIFKSFHSYNDAEAFMKKSTMKVETRAQPHILPLINKTIIYTDGSFSDGQCGFGVVIITSNNDKMIAYGRVPDVAPVTTSSGLEYHKVFDSPTNNVAELYAIYVALSLVSGDVILYTDSRYSISCLTSYVHDWMKNGWKGVANRQIIEGTFAKMQNREVMLQYVTAHKDVTCNNEADQLANQGRVSTEDLVVIKNGIRMDLK